MASWAARAHASVSKAEKKTAIRQGRSCSHSLRVTTLIGSQGNPPLHRRPGSRLERDYRLLVNGELPERPTHRDMTYSLSDFSRRLQSEL